MAVTLVRVCEGVVRPLVENDPRPLLDDPPAATEGRPVMEGVWRPLREEAADDGRWTDQRFTVGIDNLAVDTKTPQLGGHTKYCFLK